MFVTLLVSQVFNDWLNMGSLPKAASRVVTFFVSQLLSGWLNADAP